MNLQTKALYNLLRIKKEEDPSIEAPVWALEDYRGKSLEELFNDLKGLAVVLEKSSFLEYATKADTPEELAQLLSKEGASREEEDHLYLLIFELWHIVSTIVVIAAAVRDQLEVPKRRLDRYIPKCLLDGRQVNDRLYLK